MIAQQVAADASREYVDVRALLLDPVDLRGIPWRDAADRSRQAVLIGEATSLALAAKAVAGPNVEQADALAVQD